jgi:hypothetical protein
MLAKQPDERPQNAGEVYARFERAVGLSGPVRTPAPGSPITGDEIRPARVTVASGKTQLRLPLLIGSALALVVAVAVAMYFWKRVDLSGTRKLAIIPVGSPQVDRDLDDLGAWRAVALDQAFKGSRSTSRQPSVGQLA